MQNHHIKQNYPIKVALYVASQLDMEALAAILTNEGFTVLRTDETRASKTEALARMKPDLVLFDFASYRDMEAACRFWCEQDAKVVVSADRFSMKEFLDAVRFGVDGYILSRMFPTALGLALRLVCAGEPVFPAEFLDTVASFDGASPRLHSIPDEPDGAGQVRGALRPQEVCVLQMIVEGRRNKEIAHSLSVSEDMVKLHLRNIMKKINVRNRTQAALWAIQTGVVGNTVPPRGLDGHSYAGRSVQGGVPVGGGDTH
ncbi:MAG TPA: response regulator transcription factor [Azospirillaceae bacterium]|nr:response regulator transcription factor [Azospirillaceae bacterium]